MMTQKKKKKRSLINSNLEDFHLEMKVSFNFNSLI